MVLFVLAAHVRYVRPGEGEKGGGRELARLVRWRYEVNGIQRLHKKKFYDFSNGPRWKSLYIAVKLHVAP